MKKKTPPESTSEFRHNPFAKLDLKREHLPKGPTAPAAKLWSGPARAVVRFERKGRGGKEVTVVEQLDLRPKDLETWLRALKQSLGCGGVIEGTDLVVQGDQGDRIAAWLSSRGVQKVIRGA